MYVTTYEQILKERHLTKHERVAMAREVLGTVFGKSRVRIHAGSQTEYGFPDDTTHFLYITVRLRQSDKRNRKSYEDIRAEVVKILEQAKVPLYNTSYSLSNKDEYAIVLDIERAKPTTIPAFPNSFPYNELLLSGKLSAKTRTWRWGHTGLTLLYTSTSTADAVVSAHGLNNESRNSPRMVLVGVGELQPVRELTEKESKQIYREFRNGKRTSWGPGTGNFRYEFRNLKRFKNPVPFKPPQGAVRLFNVPVALVADALKEVGVSV